MFLASFLENDPLRVFYELDLLWVGVIMAMSSLPAYWFIDFVCSFRDPTIHPLWGTWLRWYSNWIGDFVLLSGAVIFICEFYRYAKIDSEDNWIVSGWVAVSAVILSLVYTFLFLRGEEERDSYVITADKINPNRIYHSLYMLFMGYILFAALIRAAAFWTYSGGGPQAAFGLSCVLGWAMTIWLDQVPNPFWKRLVLARNYNGRIIE